jgi:hypothetical protein
MKRRGIVMCGVLCGALLAGHRVWGQGAPQAPPALAQVAPLAASNPAVAAHEGLIAACAADFSVAAVERAVVQLRIEQKGASNLDPAEAAAFAKNGVESVCAKEDCASQTVRVKWCAQLTGYGNFPF